MTLVGKITAAVVVALILAVGIQTWRLGRAQGRELAARVAAQDSAFEAAGMKKATTGSQAAISAIIPDSKPQTDAVMKAKAVVAGSSHWTGSGKAIAVPISELVGPSAEAQRTASPGPPSLAGSSEAPPSVAVTPHVKIDDAVAVDDAGGIFVVRKVQAKLAVGESWASEWQDLEADPGSTTMVSPEIEKAWKAYRNPPPKFAILPRGITKWRAGWFFGPALTVGVDGKVGVGVVLGWGVQF